MYLVRLISALIFTQEFANMIPRDKREWEWPKETVEKDKQLHNQLTTPAPDEADNPCNRPPPKTPDFKKPGRRISEAKCLEYLWDTEARLVEEKNGEDCLKYLLEQPINKRPSFAVGGRDTVPGEFPHMGAVGWRTVVNTWVFKCGSSLISDKFMLTAAHCSKSPPDSNLVSEIPQIVRLGDKNIIPKLDVITYDKPILRIINHPQYASPKKYYDIALIELQEQVYFTKFMMPACLWTNPDTTGLGNATLTGWGVIDTVNRRTSPELQAAVVDVLDSSVCDELLKTSCNRLWCGMRDNQVCAGKLAGGVDACQGDSGGPLQVKIPLPPSTNQSMHYVIGVTSFGIGCAKKNLPGIYTNVASFIDWIESVVWPNEM